MTYRMSALMFGSSAVALGVLLAGCTPMVRLSASPTVPPGTTLGPETSGLATATSTLTVESVNDFAGTVKLSASCCQEVVRNQWVPLDGTGNFVCTFSQNPLNIPANGKASTTLDCTVPAVPFTNSPAVAFGGYVVPVVAKDPYGKTLYGDVNTKVGVKVLPASEPRPNCEPDSAVEVLPLNDPTSATSSILNVVINAAEADPRKKTLVIAVFLKTGPDVWRWTIEDGAMAPGTAQIVLNNSGSLEKEVSTVGCSSNATSVRVQSGGTGQIFLHEGVDTTLIFGKNSGTWTNVAVFAEPAFWTVFGGRKHTFDWIKEQ